MTSAYKIPKMTKAEYDALITNGVVSRIAFCNDNKPYIAPFIYVFSGGHLYFLSTRYGKKMAFFSSNPQVSVEIENVAADMEHYRFVTLQGRLAEVTESAVQQKIKKEFAGLITSRRLSSHALWALGYTPAESPDNIVSEDRTMVWRLDSVSDITALKDAS